MASMFIRADRHVHDEVGMAFDGNLSLFDVVKSVSDADNSPYSCARVIMEGGRLVTQCPWGAGLRFQKLVKRRSGGFCLSTEGFVEVWTVKYVQQLPLLLWPYLSLYHKWHTMQHK